MVTLLKLAGARPATPEALRAEIIAAEEAIRTARAEAQRLTAAAGDELDDTKAEDLLCQSRAQERAGRRAEARIPELREKLADALWTAREQAFQRYRKLLTAAAKKAITALEGAAAANAELALIRQQADAELGHHATQLPMLAYVGILLPDLVRIWRGYTERAIETMERAQLTRPPVPTPANDSRPYRNDAARGPVVLAGGVIVSNQVRPATKAKPAQADPAPAPVVGNAKMTLPKLFGGDR